MKFLLKDNSTVNDLISALDQSGNGAVAIVDSNNKLVGLTTDGDLRKALLNDTLSLSNIINKSVTSITDDSSINEKISLMKKIHRRHLPIVTNDGHFKELFCLDDLNFNIKPNYVVIAAGGLGKRLGDLTQNTPKPMISLNGKPILEHIIMLLKHHGYSKFLVSVNFKSEQIISYFGDGKKLGCEIQYLEETKRLGTAGALSLIKEKLLHPFFVINGDILSSVDFDEILKTHISTKSFATLSSRKIKNKLDYGIIDTNEDGQVISISEKPTFDFQINAGIYIFNPKVVDYVKPNCYLDMPNLFRKIISLGHKVQSYEITDYWIDVGQKNDLYKAIKKLEK